MIVEPRDPLEMLRDKLWETSENLRDRVRKTDSSLETVAQGWKDSLFDKFRKDFEKDKEIMGSLCKEIDEFNDEVLYPLYKTLLGYLNLNI